MRNETVTIRDASEFGEESRPIRFLHVPRVHIAEDSEVPDAGASKGRDADFLAAFAEDELLDGAADPVPFPGWDEGFVLQHGVGELDVADDAVGVGV